MSNTILDEVDRIKTSCTSISESTSALFDSIGMETTVTTESTVDTNSAAYSEDVERVKAYTDTMCETLKNFLLEKYGIEHSFSSMTEMLDYLIDEFLPNM